MSNRYLGAYSILAIVTQVIIALMITSPNIIDMVVSADRLLPTILLMEIPFACCLIMISDQLSQPKCRGEVGSSPCLGCSPEWKAYCWENMLAGCSAIKQYHLAKGMRK